MTKADRDALRLSVTRNVSLTFPDPSWLIPSICSGGWKRPAMVSRIELELESGEDTANRMGLITKHAVFVALCQQSVCGKSGGNAAAW